MTAWSARARTASSWPKTTTKWPSAYNIVAGNIVIPVKRGWDYLWFRYADAEDDSAKVMVKRPVSAHLERVFDYTNFALLGIGL